MEINYSPYFSYEHSVNNVMHPAQHVFDMYSEDKTKKLGTLVCHKSELPLRPNYNGSVLAIDFLEVSDKNKGTGTKILKFAKDYSQKIGCNGYMTLKSDGTYSPERIPHLFYRKFGFSTSDTNTNKKLDRFIQLKQNATSRDFPCLIMHYPPLHEQTTGSTKLLNRILRADWFENLQKSFRKIIK